MGVRVLVTGIGGAVGTELASFLARAPAGISVTGVFSGASSRDAFLARAPEAVRSAVETAVCDLRDPARVAALAASLPPAERTVVVHAAANVSWTASEDTADRDNVTVTRNVADLARRVPGDNRIIYVSSAYTAVEGWEYRNTYESSKARGERVLRAEYPDLKPVVFSCSLVVGHSATGAIARFHGIYPLLALIDRHNPPFLPGRRDCRLDIVPVDWVAAELDALIGRVVREEPCPDVVVSAGERAPVLADVVEWVTAILNRTREEENLAHLKEFPLVPFRRWDFLRRSMDAWNVTEIPMPDRRFLDRLIGVYRPYFEDDRVLPPRNTVLEPPPWRDYTDAAVTYWSRSSASRRSRHAAASA